MEFIVFKLAMLCLKLAHFSIHCGIGNGKFFIWIGDRISKKYREKQ